MILALLGCVPPFPSWPDKDSGADTGPTDTALPTTAETGAPVEPVQSPLQDLAQASAGGKRWPVGLSQLDTDAGLEILASHPWQADSDPASWMALEPDGFSLVEVTGFPPRPIEAGGEHPCLMGQYTGALFLASADGRADIDGDGHHDVVVGTRSSAQGGLVTLHRSPDGPLSEDPTGDVVSWCFEGDEQFGAQVLLVPDAFGGPAVAVSLAVGVVGRPAGIALYGADAPAGAQDPSNYRLWLTLDEVGASVGGTIGAADLDGNGVASLLVGAEGDGGYDGARVWLLDEQATGELTTTNVDLALEGNVSAGDAVDSDCGSVSLATGDLDGDGAVEVLMGFSRHDRLTVAGQGEFIGGDGTPAEDLAGILGPAGVCFGASIALLERDGLMEVAISAPRYDESRGRIWVVEGGRLRAGLLDIEEGDYRLAILGTDPGAEAGGAMVGGDADGDGLGDLILAETSLYSDVTWMIPGSSL